MNLKKINYYLSTVAALLSLSLPFAACYDSEDFNQNIPSVIENDITINEVVEDVISVPLTATETNLEDRLKSLTNPLGQAVFSEEDVSVLIDNNIPFDYASELTLAGFDGRKIYLYHKLGLETDEIIYFKDTEKPNAVIVFPVFDPKYGNWKRPAFVENINTLALFNQIKQEYDSFVLITGNEQDIYNTLITIPNIELFYLAGHGTKTSLYFQAGENNNNLKSASERNYISIQDTELEKYLDNLNPQGVIFW